MDGAQRYVHMLFYIFEDDDVGRRVADALRRAARRGVAVRVLMDAIGSRGGLKGLGPGLRAAGAEVHCRDAACGSGVRTPRASTCATTARSSSSTDACAFFGSQNIVSAHANRGMVNEEMLVRATGPIVRHLHAVLLGDRYLGDGRPAAGIR